MQRDEHIVEIFESMSNYYFTHLSQQMVFQTLASKLWFLVDYNKMFIIKYSLFMCIYVFSSTFFMF